MHGSGVHQMFALQMLKKHLRLEANIADINNVPDQPEKPASGRGILMRGGGGKGRREILIYTRAMAAGQLSQL